ncbi:MAG: sulfotransferase domain-containing protein [Acidocella sp.]|nr:sulfotransferase domain-containing protein [Acidocella sp.]
MGKIVWLASYPKSGNTWLRVFLHNYITQPEAPYSINALTDFTAVESTAAFFAPYDARPASTFSTADVQRMRPKVHAYLTKLHEDLVFIKTHNAALKIHDVELCTTAVSAGAVYIVRDPRDVAVSYARYTGQSIDQTIAFMGKQGAANRSTDVQVFEYLSSWSAHVQSWIVRPKSLVVRYEDLKADPVKAFGTVVHFLGDDANPARLEKAIEFSGFDVVAGQERMEGYQAHTPGAAAAFFREGKAGAWREVLTAAQVAQIETDHGAMMRRFGYIS